MNDDFFKALAIKGYHIEFVEKDIFKLVASLVPINISTGSWDKIIEDASIINQKPVQNLTFEVTVLYDKGFGPECLNIPQIEAPSVEEAQIKAEKAATAFFFEKFGKKTQWNEVKIRPVK